MMKDREKLQFSDLLDKQLFVERNYMAVKILYIPVYYLSKENHYNKWRNKKNRKISAFTRLSLY